MQLVQNTPTTSVAPFFILSLYNIFFFKCRALCLRNSTAVQRDSSTRTLPCFNGLLPSRFPPFNNFNFSISAADGVLWDATFVFIQR